MVCRTTALGSAVTSLARLRSGLEDQQTLSAYHGLLRQGQFTAAPSAGEKTRLLNELRTIALNDTTLSATRRDSLTRRFAQAERQPMDGRSFYAAQRVLTRTEHLQTALTSFYDSAARDLGVSRTEMADFVAERRVYARAHPDELTQPVPETPEAAVTATPHGLSHVDRYTAFAVRQLQDRVHTAQQSRIPTPTAWHTSGGDESRRYSYNAESGCLTFEFTHDNPVSYQVTQGTFDDMHARLQNDLTIAGATAELRANPNATRYDTAEAAATAAGGNQCGTCGQFAGPGHDCPVRDSAGERHETLQRARGLSEAPAARLRRPVGIARLHRGEAGAIRMPAAADIRTTAAAGPLQVPVAASINQTLEAGTGPRGDVRGRVHITEVRADDGTLTYTVTPVTAPGPDGSYQLRCQCADYQANYDCVHVRQVIADITHRVNSDENWAHYLPLARQTVGADLARERVESLDAQQVARSDWGQDSTSYTADPYAFRAAYQAAKDRAGNGEDPIPYMSVNATNGLGAEGTGRGFGIELEFDFPDGIGYHERNDALEAIGEDLANANLTTDSDQTQYHAAERNGYFTEHAGGWSFERDETVAGEIVSPIMHDTPETWENIAKVCAIVKAHGGTAKTSTGSHVHVSTHNFDHTVENYNQLMGGFTQYEDVLYRMAMNPDSAHHRGTYWCRPNSVPSTGYASVTNARNTNGHGNGVNLAAVWGEQSDHVEFRLWDGTLSPGAIQTQVKLSLGMTEAAFRGTAHQLPPEPLGTHRSYNRATFGQSRRLTGTEFDTDTESFRRMADTLFDRDEDKAQAAALFAMTKWQRTNR